MSAQTNLEFGVTLWNVGDHEYANPDAFRQVARTAETVGLDFLWAGEHVILPEEIPDTYPFTPDGTAPLNSSQDTYDVFTLLGHLAGITDDLTVGTNVTVVPFRRPVVLAKSILTLHALTDGDFELGISPGWMETEFEVLDVPFEERGGRTDEFLEMFERICAEGELSFEGDYHSFQRTGFHPVPDDGETPPIWIGGKSGATIRRIAQFGDGWSSFWDRPEDVRQMKSRLMNAWSDFDRDGEPEIAVARPVHVGTDTEHDTDRPFVGSVDSIIEDLEAYADAGMTRLVLTTYDTAVDAQVEQFERFGNQVLPSL